MGKNVFLFPNGFYKQIEEKTIENLLSPFLTKIYMSRLKQI